MSVRSVLAEIVASGAAPGAAAAWGTAGRVEALAAGGLTGSAEAGPLTAAHMFDLASLTKPMATGSVCMALWGEGALDLGAPVARWLPEVPDGGATVENLLRHESGAPAYCSLEARAPAPEEALAALLALPGEGAAPAGPVYSCVGYIRLAELLRRAVGEPLDALFARHVAGPLGLDLRYMPGPEGSVPTVAWEPWRRRVAEARGQSPGGPWLQGEPHDPLAWLLGGVGGNAGLFGSAAGVGRFAQAVLRRQGPFTEAAQSRFFDPSRRSGDRVLGWHLRSDEGSSAGPSWSGRSIGHTGFTGTSLWIDLEAGVFAALLTSALHPGGDPAPVRRFRAPFSEAAMAEAVAWDR